MLQELGSMRLQTQCKPGVPAAYLKHCKNVAVEIREVDAPEDVEPLHWRLLSTLDASSFESCRCIIACNGARWSIEEFHKTLKTGCGVERLQLKRKMRTRIRY